MEREELYRIILCHSKNSIRKILHKKRTWSFIQEVEKQILYYVVMKRDLTKHHQQAVVLVSILSYHQICNFFHHLIMVILEWQNCTVAYHFAIILSSLGSKLSNIFTGICISLWIMNKWTDLSACRSKSIKSCVQLVFLRIANLEIASLYFGKSISNSSLKCPNPVQPCLS